MNTLHQYKTSEYAIIGAGPAGICAIPFILNTGVPGSDIIWIDPIFGVGYFGTTLSMGSSVPGNISVASYQKTNKAIIDMLPVCAPKNNNIFKLNQLNEAIYPSLNIAAEPLRHFTRQLRNIVHSIEGKVLNIVTLPNELKVEIQLNNGKTAYILSKRIILATGASPKKINLPSEHHKIIMINPEIAFIESELKKYKKINPLMKTVAVIGSSHSAALATMHLLKAGLTVRQFMNKEYKYATPSITSDGTRFTMFDNTGLKGDVAKFTKQLIHDIASKKSAYNDKLTFYIGKNTEETNRLLKQHLFECSHAIGAIGYAPSNTLTINQLPLSQFTHNNKSTEFKEVKGLFGIGAAFPLKVKSLSDETEFAVGVEKFATTVSTPNIIEIWQNNIADFKTR